ncbi:MAG: hypothetical protein ACRERD_20510 [Candidatus Binatia bacterium]
MARKKKLDVETTKENTQDERLAILAVDAPVAGVVGPGRWLVAEYSPTALFSLKMSLATSSVGKTLVVPTPYSIKMAFVDAAFRSGLSDHCAEFLRSLVGVAVRIAPPASACVTHTFVKVRQESRDADPLRPYIASIAYREVVHHQGVWRWAFDLAAGDDILAARLVHIAPHVTYIGKRGSFVQFVGLSRCMDLGPDFTQPVQNQGSWTPPPRAHITPLDDFGPEADLETLSSFTAKKPSRDKHRRFVQTIIPLGLVNTGPGFSEYKA